MRIDLWTIGLQAINVLILLFVLGRFFFRPVAAAIADRQAQANALLDDAARAKRDAEAERDALKAQQAQIDAARALALQEAQAHADEARAALTAAARADAERIRADARAEMAHLRIADERALQKQAGLLAIDIAQKALARLPEAARVEGLAARLSEGLAAWPRLSEAPAREGALSLLTAAPLPPSTADACRAALSRAFGTPVALTIECDPALLAGFELRLPDAVLRDNLRADLQEIATALSATPGGDHERG